MNPLDLVIWYTNLILPLSPAILFGSLLYFAFKNEKTRKLRRGYAMDWSEMFGCTYAEACQDLYGKFIK